MTSPAHTSDAHALVRQAAREDRSMTERELRDLHQSMTCLFLVRHTGLPLEEVVEIYEQEQAKCL